LHLVGCLYYFISDARSQTSNSLQKLTVPRLDE